MLYRDRHTLRRPPRLVVDWFLVAGVVINAFLVGFFTALVTSKDMVL